MLGESLALGERPSRVDMLSFCIVIDSTYDLFGPRARTGEGRLLHGFRLLLYFSNWYVSLFSTDAILRSSSVAFDSSGVYFLLSVQKLCGF